MSVQRTFAAVRFLLGAVTLTAVGIQLGVHIHHGYNVVNFFSYFTNLSNLLAAVALIVESVLSWQGRELGRNWALLRCLSVVCMALVGIVFSALLRNVDLGSMVPWINTWLHFVMPVAVVADWLVQPPRQPLRWGALGTLVIAPLAYLAYSLIRGAVTGWYAYPFLNPANGGYPAVALTCVGIAVVFVAASALALLAGRRLRPLVPAGSGRQG